MAAAKVVGVHALIGAVLSELEVFTIKELKAFLGVFASLPTGFGKSLDAMGPMTLVDANTVSLVLIPTGLIQSPFRVDFWTRPPLSNYFVWMHSVWRVRLFTTTSLMCFCPQS